MTHRLGFRLVLSVALAAVLVATVVPMVAAYYNPWGCLVRADNPHLSGHYPGTVAAHGEVNCRSNPQNLELDIHVQSQSCFFFICSWTTRGNNSVYYNNWGRSWIALDVGANCNNSNSTAWRLEASSSAWLTGGTTYKATVDSPQITIACGP